METDEHLLSYWGLFNERIDTYTEMIQDAFRNNDTQAINNIKFEVSQMTDSLLQHQVAYILWECHLQNNEFSLAIEAYTYAINNTFPHLTALICAKVVLICNKTWRTEQIDEYMNLAVEKFDEYKEIQESE